MVSDSGNIKSEFITAFSNVLQLVGIPTNWHNNSLIKKKQSDFYLHRGYSLVSESYHFHEKSTVALSIRY